MGTECSDKKTKVHILTEDYDNGGKEPVGCFDSERALVVGFARHIANGIRVEMGDKASVQAVVDKVAVNLAVLIPALLSEEWALDDEGCCSYGKCVYGWQEMDLESAGES